MILNSAYDMWQILNDLQLPCVPSTNGQPIAGYASCNGTQLAVMEQYRVAQLEVSSLVAVVMFDRRRRCIAGQSQKVPRLIPCPSLACIRPVQFAIDTSIACADRLHFPLQALSSALNSYPSTGAFVTSCFVHEQSVDYCSTQPLPNCIGEDRCRCAHHWHVYVVNACPSTESVDCTGTTTVRD